MIQAIFTAFAFIVLLTPVNQEVFEPSKVLGQGIHQTYWDIGQSRLYTVELSGVSYLTVSDRILDQSYKIELEAPIAAAERSADGKYLAVAADKTVYVYEVGSEASKLMTRLEGHSSYIWSLAWSPDGRYLVSTSFDERNTLQIWETATWTQVIALSYGELQSAVWSPDGANLAVVNTNQGGIFLMDVSATLEKGEIVHKHIGPSGSEAGRANSVVWILSGEAVVIGHSSGLIYTVDINTDETLFSFKAHEEGWVSALDIDPTGLLLASAGEDGFVRIWDISDGKLLSEYPKGDVYTSQIDFSPDGTMLAFGVATDSTISAQLTGGVQIVTVAEKVAP